MMAPKWGSKAKTFPVDFELVEVSTKPKFCKVLHIINIGTWKFIQLNWSTS
jgi:hypothetical protein